MAKLTKEQINQYRVTIAIGYGLVLGLKDFNNLLDAIDALELEIVSLQTVSDQHCRDAVELRAAFAEAKRQGAEAMRERAKGFLMNVSSNSSLWMAEAVGKLPLDAELPAAPGKEAITLHSNRPNPPDCTCEFVHCSNVLCGSKVPSWGFVKENERIHPAAPKEKA